MLGRLFHKLEYKRLCTPDKYTQGYQLLSYTRHTSDTFFSSTSLKNKTKALEILKPGKFHLQLLVAKNEIIKLGHLEMLVFTSWIFSSRSRGMQSIVPRFFVLQFPLAIMR